jgi:hypothetical protein
VRYQAAPHPGAPTGAQRSLRDEQDRVSATARSHDPTGSGTLRSPRSGGVCGRSSMVEPQPSKLAMRVRFPSPAPRVSPGRRLAVHRLWTFDAGLFLFCAPACPSWRSLTVCRVARWAVPTRVEAIGDGAVALVAGMQVDHGRRWRRHHPRTNLSPAVQPAVRPEPRHCVRPYGLCSVAARSNEPDP